MDETVLEAYRQALGDFHEGTRLEAPPAPEPGIVDIGRLRAEVMAAKAAEPERLPAPKGPASIHRLHALHRSRVDVYDDGNPANAHLKGEWIVEYLPTEATDPTIKPIIEQLQATGNETELMDFMVSFLERCVFAWNLDDPVNRESIIALRPVLQMQLIGALQRDALKKSKSA